MFDKKTNVTVPLTLTCSPHILCSQADEEGLPISGTEKRHVVKKARLSNKANNQHEYQDDANTT